MAVSELAENLNHISTSSDNPGCVAAKQAQQEFLDWLSKHGSSFGQLELRLYDTEYEYRGVHAKNDIAEDQLILLVPRNLILTTEVAKDSEIGRSIIRENISLRSRHSYLAMMLLQERAKGQASFWWHYIRTLPQNYINMPINFNDEELKLLKGSFSLEKIWIRKESLQQEFESITSRLPSVRKFTLEDFTWARNVVITRVFGLVINGVKTEGLVPFADFLNHKRPRETKWTFDEYHDAFTIVSTSPMKAGTVVSDSYGRKCNSRFFVNYGFSLEQNEDNEAVLAVTLSPNAPFFQAKKRLLGFSKDSSTTRTFQVGADTRHAKFLEAMSFCRLGAASEDDLAQLRHPGTNLDSIGPINVNNEVLALQMIREAARRTLAGFAHSIEVDNEILSDPSISFNTRNSILMVRGEKQVCQWYVNLVDSMIPVLRNEIPPTETPGQASPFSSYMFDVVLVLHGRISKDVNNGKPN